jgi:hypothetical protein
MLSLLVCASYIFQFFRARLIDHLDPASSSSFQAAGLTGTAMTYSLFELAKEKAEEMIVEVDTENGEGRSSVSVRRGSQYILSGHIIALVTGAMVLQSVVVVVFYRPHLKVWSPSPLFSSPLSFLLLAASTETRSGEDEGKEADSVKAAEKATGRQSQ